MSRRDREVTESMHWLSAVVPPGCQGPPKESHLGNLSHMGAGCSKGITPAHLRYVSVANYVASSEPDDVAAFPAAGWGASQPPWKGHPRVAGRAPSRLSHEVDDAVAEVVSVLNKTDLNAYPCSPPAGASPAATPAQAAPVVGAADSNAHPCSPPAGASPAATLAKAPVVHDVRLSKHLTKLLRHQAIEADIDIDHDGWALVSDALSYVNAISEINQAIHDEITVAAAPSRACTEAWTVGATWTDADVREMVRLNDKQRFELREDPRGLQIRATEGAITYHPSRRPSISRAIELGHELTKPGLGRLSRRSNESDGIVDVAVVPQDMVLCPYIRHTPPPSLLRRVSGVL